MKVVKGKVIWRQTEQGQIGNGCRHYSSLRTKGTKLRPQNDNNPIFKQSLASHWQPFVITFGGRQFINRSVCAQNKSFFSRWMAPSSFHPLLPLVITVIFTVLWQTAWFFSGFLHWIKARIEMAMGDRLLGANKRIQLRLIAIKMVRKMLVRGKNGIKRIND